MKIRRAALGFVFLLTAVPWWVAAGAEMPNVMAPEEVFAFAGELEAGGDAGRAATEYLRYVSFAARYPEHAYPNLLQARYRYALNLARAGESDRALRAFASFGARHPRSPLVKNALLEIAAIYSGAGRADEALSRYDTLIRLAPGDPLADVARLRAAWLAAREEDMPLATRYLEDVRNPAYQVEARELRAGLARVEELPRKDPQVAGILSAVLPGAGHAYLGRDRDALFAFLSNVLLIGSAIQAYDEGLEFLAATLGLLEAGWYSGTVYGAVSLAHRHNREQRERRLEDLKVYLKPEDGLDGAKLELQWKF